MVKIKVTGLSLHDVY